MNVFGQIVFIILCLSLACSFLGPFLILQKISMVVDAISHSILLGIVLAFFLVKDLNSPLLIVGATLMGLFTVYLIGALTRTRLLDQDAAIGIVFPLLFSIGVLLISLKSGNIHLDVDTVLLGKVELAPFDFLYIGGVDYGAKAMYISLFCLLINGFFVLRYFKELKLISFDPDLAKALTLPVTFINLIFMTLVSVTTVASFSAVGSILLISLMVGPSASAYLLSKDLKTLLVYSLLIALVDSLFGTLLAFAFDLSIAGSVSVVIGLVFILCFLLGKEEGLFSVYQRRKRQKRLFLQINMLFHLYQHRGQKDYESEARVDEMNRHLRLENVTYKEVLRELEREKWVEIKGNTALITQEGREFLLEQAKGLGLLNTL